MMTEWIEWNGGECPIKSDKTRVEYKMKNASLDIFYGSRLRWNWEYNGNHGDIIAYRIIEDHEPKEPIMTREQITAQIEALQKQLDAMPVVVLRRYWDGKHMTMDQHPCDTHYFDIETINGVPHIHGVAMKEVGE
jgi:hypothetical protein